MMIVKKKFVPIFVSFNPRCRYDSRNFSGELNSEILSRAKESNLLAYADNTHLRTAHCIHMLPGILVYKTNSLSLHSLIISSLYKRHSLLDIAISVLTTALSCSDSHLSKTSSNNFIDRSGLIKLAFIGVILCSPIFFLF